jgi:hypothetical protein
MNRSESLITSSLLLTAPACGGGGPTTANTPSEMFEHVILSPIPDGITDLQGTGDTWQGYSLWLRFHADESALETILATGYTAADWAMCSGEFRLPDGYDRFDPDWDAGSVGPLECWTSPASNGWTHEGTHWLLVDRGSGTVWFRGLGA